MKKRLRKKRHLGEFKELGVVFNVELKQNANISIFFDDLVNYCEKNNLYCGGGISRYCLEVTFYTRNKSSQKQSYNIDKEEVDLLFAWFAAQEDVTRIQYTDFMDLNKDTEEIIYIHDYKK